MTKRLNHLKTVLKTIANASKELEVYESEVLLRFDGHIYKHSTVRLDEIDDILWYLENELDVLKNIKFSQAETINKWGSEYFATRPTNKYRIVILTNKFGMFYNTIMGGTKPFKLNNKTIKTDEDFSKLNQYIDAEKSITSQQKGADLDTEDTQGEVALWIKYNEATQEIVINDYFILKRLRFGNANDLIFRHLFLNQNKSVSEDELKNEALKSNKDIRRFHALTNDLGFKHNLKRAFFDLTEDNIRLVNPVTKQRLKQLNISDITIPVNRNLPVKRTHSKK